MAIINKFLKVIGTLPKIFKAIGHFCKYEKSLRTIVERHYGVVNSKSWNKFKAENRKLIMQLYKDLKKAGI